MKKSGFVSLLLLAMALSALGSAVQAQPPTPEHDIAVTGITLSKTIFWENYSLPVNVTVENQGNHTETFNVTISANTTTIHEFENVVLENGTSTGLAFSWNTTSWDKGNYTISAFASPVTNETETEDNLLECWIFISIKGDVNGDRYVNFYDGIVAGTAFASKPGDPNWNSNTDLKEDNAINYIDVLELAQNFDESWS